MVVGISCLLGAYVEKAEPAGAPNLSKRDYTVPFTLTSFALSLLLVFRTNNSYDRWWEARKILSGLFGVTRDIVRISMTISRPNCQHLIAMVARWTIAMPYVLHHHVTEFKDVPRPLQRVLLEAELDYLAQARHRPTAVMQALPDAACALSTADVKYVAVSNRIGQYADYVAAAERLSKQPNPSAYTRHTSRFIITWIIFLPFALWRTCEWLTPAVAGVVAFLLIGVENIGIQIEQPFSVLPLDDFARIIERDVLEQMQMRDESESLIPEAELDAEGRAGEQSSPKAADFDKMLRRGADAGTLWPTGYGPQSVPQHITIIPDDEVHLDKDAEDAEAGQGASSSIPKSVYMMAPTTGRLMMNGSFSAAAAGRMKPGSFTGGLDGASFTGAMGPPRMANSSISFGARGRTATAAPESCPSVSFSIPSDIPEGRETAPDAVAIDMAQLKEGAHENGSGGRDGSKKQ